MSEDFGAGSIAAALIHLSDGWYEEFDPGFIEYDKYIQSPDRKAGFCYL